MDILLLIDVLPFNNSGLTLRLVKVFEKLSQSHKIHFFYIGNAEFVQENLDILNKFCTSINKVPLKKKDFLLGRILNVLLLKHGAYVKYRFKKDYISVTKAIRELVNDKKIEAVHVYGCFTAQYVQDFKGVFKLWDIADSYSLDIKRRMKNAPLRYKFSFLMCMFRIFNYEKEIMRNFDKTIFVSKIDANEYKSLNLKEKIAIIPNGVDLDYYKPNNKDAEEPNSIIFTGHMSFLPNIEAVKYFISKIYPLLKEKNSDIKFYVVGSDVTDEIKSLGGKDGIIVTGKVDDIRLYIEKAAVFVNPMISGCGIKNKLLQAMSLQKAVVSTSLGAESVLAIHKKHIMLADKPSDFAERVVELIEDGNLRKRIGEEARRCMEINYGWDMALRVYQEIYESIQSSI